MLHYEVGTAGAASDAGAANIDHAAPPPTLVPSQPAPAAPPPTLVPSQPAPAAPPTPLTPPVSTTPPETRGGTAGHSGDSVGRPAEPLRAAKVDGATPIDGVGADRNPPLQNRHHKALSTVKAKTADTAKPAIPDPSGTSVNHATPASSTPPGEATAASSTTPETPPPGERPAVRPAAPMQLSCEAGEKDAAPGQQFRIHCKATNPNGSVARVMSVEVAVGTGAALVAVGPALPELEPHGHLEFDVTPTLPGSVVSGSSLPIVITINALDSAPVHQQIVVPIR
jgi:hypothetical protein